MKVIDYIKSVDKNKMVCVGASGSYLFIGTAERFLHDMNSLDDINTGKVEKYLKRRKIALKNIQLGGSNLAFPENKCIEDIKKYEDYLSNYIPISKREVIDVYNRISDDATVLIVKGEEQGSYWFQYEYDCGFLFDTNKDFKKYVNKFADDILVRPPELYSYAAIREYANYIYSK